MKIWKNKSNIKKNNKDVNNRKVIAEDSKDDAREEDSGKRYYSYENINLS